MIRKRQHMKTPFPLLAPLTLVVLLASHSALAQDVPRGVQSIDLLRQCQSRGDWFSMALEHDMDTDFFGNFDLMMCTSYISGVADMNALYVGIFGQGLFLLSKAGLIAGAAVQGFHKVG